MTPALAVALTEEFGPIQRKNNLLYCLNSRGHNRWTALVQPGFDDDAKRVSDDECARVAQALAEIAVPLPETDYGLQPTGEKRREWLVNHRNTTGKSLKEAFEEFVRRWPEARLPTPAMSVEGLADEIRRLDGRNSMGPAALAQALMPYLTQHLTSPRVFKIPDTASIEAQSKALFGDGEDEEAKGERLAFRVGAQWAKRVILTDATV